MNNEINLNRYYGIYDKVAMAMAHVIQQKNDKVASRTFGVVQNDKTSIIHEKPEDYELWYLFTLDDNGNVVDATKMKIEDGKARAEA